MRIRRCLPRCLPRCLRRCLNNSLWLLTLVGASTSTCAAQASEAEEIDNSLLKIERAEKLRMPTGFIQLDETVISGNQELPKVLYILPWRQPSGLPDIDLQAEFTEMDIFRRLYPPAYRRELKYFATLDGKNSEE